MPSQRLVRTADLCAVLATGATACGGQKDGKPAAVGAANSASASPSASPTPTMATNTLSADQIKAQTQAAMSQLSSMKVAGTITTGGQKIAINLSADKQGNCDGTISIDSNGSVEILHSDSNSRSPSRRPRPTR